MSELMVSPLLDAMEVGECFASHDGVSCYNIRHPESGRPEVVDMYNEPVDFRVVEDLPQFPGGASEFMKWLTRNLKYPVSAQNKKIKGRVVAQFIVNTDGSVSDLELTEHLEAACDREVLRVLRMMPKWQAGVMNAKPCRTKVCIPIVFNF